MLIDNYANRIRFVRSLTKLSREDFEKKYGINRNTLKAWELGVNKLTEKTAIQIANAIQNEGYSCSPEWLIFGLGFEPRPLDDNLLFNHLSEQTKAIYEADFFKKNNQNSLVSMIVDTSVEPHYLVGDYVGGIMETEIDRTKLKNYIGNISMICLNNETITIRKIFYGKENFIVLCPINKFFEAEMIKISEINSIANIIWHRSANGQNNDN